MSFLIVCVLSTCFIGYSQTKPAQKTGQNNSSKITLEIKGMDVVDALKILANKGNLNLSISGNVRGRITLFLKDIDVLEALEIAVVSAGLAYEKKGKVIFVMTDREYEAKYGKKYSDQRKMKLFTLKHAKAPRVVAMLSQISSKIGKVIADEGSNTLAVIDVAENIEKIAKLIERLDKPVQTKIFQLNYLAVADAEKKISEMLSKDIGTIKVDEAANKIIVVDYPEKINEIAKVIEAFDERPLQVLIDAKIIELSPSEKFYSGINWQYWIEKYFKINGAFDIPSPAGITDKISFGTIGAADPTKVGQYTSVIDFLEIFGKSKILSSPRILVLNNQEAKILVGTKDAYITSSVSEVGTSLTTTQSVNFVDVGVKLYVTPTITRNGYITLKIRPEISSSVRETIISEDKQTEVPIVTTSEAETTLMVKDGVSIIMGGLRKTTDILEQKQVPILGHIPVLGVFFRSKKAVKTKTELVILLTPYIVSGAGAIEDEIERKRDGNMWESDAIHEFEKEKFSRRLNKEIQLESEINRKSRIKRSNAMWESDAIEKVKKEEPSIKEKHESRLENWQDLIPKGYSKDEVAYTDYEIEDEHPRESLEQEIMSTQIGVEEVDAARVSAERLLRRLERR
ncbi:MAG: hypothetical protein NG737_07400 [Omnitrophica bacterium]|nr:hypothetical protein [Candidatus Omnitrophota bacterium]